MVWAAIDLIGFVRGILMVAVAWHECRATGPLAAGCEIAGSVSSRSESPAWARITSSTWVYEPLGVSGSPAWILPRCEHSGILCNHHFILIVTFSVKIADIVFEEK
jgi:hypothetical protein